MSRRSLFEESNNNYGKVMEENDKLKKELEKEKKEIINLNKDFEEIKTKNNKIIGDNKTHKEVINCSN